MREKALAEFANRSPELRRLAESDQKGREWRVSLRIAARNHLVERLVDDYGALEKIVAEVVRGIDASEFVMKEYSREERPAPTRSNCSESPGRTRSLVAKKSRARVRWRDDENEILVAKIQTYSDQNQGNM